MMAPLPLPTTPSGVARVRLAIARIDHAAPETSGRQGGVQVGWPLWQGTWEIDRVDRLSADLWEVFEARLRGRQRLFLAGDTSRPFPIAHAQGFAGMVRAGGGAFDGSATSWAQNIDADGNAAIALTGLPAGFTLSVGDYIGWKWDAAGAPALSYHRRTLARVVLGAAASGAGAATVTIEPPLDPLVVPAGAKAHFDTPQACFRLEPDKSGLGPRGGGSGIAGGNFTATQDLRL